MLVNNNQIAFLSSLVDYMISENNNEKWVSFLFLFLGVGMVMFNIIEF